MRFMHLVGLLIIPLTVCSQSSDLTVQHGILTNDCKYIRGHAGRVVAEASEPEMNVDVAMAHCKEIAKYQAAMEEQIRITKKLLTPDQLKPVEREYTGLEKTCSAVKELAIKLTAELEKRKPDRRTVRQIGSTLKQEMGVGNDLHERMKRKLGLVQR